MNYLLYKKQVHVASLRVESASSPTSWIPHVVIQHDSTAGLDRVSTTFLTRCSEKNMSLGWALYSPILKFKARNQPINIPDQGLVGNGSKPAYPAILKI